MLENKLWQVLLDVFSSRQTLDSFATESCGKIPLPLQKREIDVYIVIKTQGRQLPHGDIHIFATLCHFMHKIFSIVLILLTR